ncbi:hypothetical protein BJ944DRAFT_289301 [Cunninghamella echinulata]|nr:hypothetical protein BJ944DRAFT_289301 [Cunninghamella echinulata]
MKAANKKKIFLSFDCYICEANNFSQKQKLLAHLEKHNINLTPAKRGKPPREDTITVKNIEEATIIYHGCPSCYHYCKSLEELSVHIKQHFVDMEDHDSEYTEIDINDNELVRAIPTTLDIPDLLSVTHITEKYQRNYEDAILYACQQQSDTDETKAKTMFILDTLRLKPLSIVNNIGEEYNALAHPNIIQKAISEHSSIQVTLPMKRPYHETENPLCPNCSPTIPEHLESLLAISPYSKLLRQQHYMEISQEICELLNYDWTFYPQMMYACAQMLAGAILWNCNNGEAVIINNVEIYGRRKTVDDHREPFGIKKQDSTADTSLPPPFKTKYSNVWPVTLDIREGKKLMIGTETFNALITSSMRLDKRLKPSIGAITMNFTLLQKKDSESCSVYLDKESVEKAMMLAKNEQAISISKTNILYQLRQLNTKFDMPSTFYLCRASGPITKSHIYQPYSLFTLADFDRGRTPATTIFSLIATSIIKHGAEANLPIQFVKKCNSQCKGKILSIFQEILDLYGSSTQITILGNNELNGKLETLAGLLPSYIATANKSVENEITKLFDLLD